MPKVDASVKIGTRTYATASSSNRCVKTMQMWANSHRNLKIFSARFQKLEKTISPTNKKFPRKNPKSKPISKETKNSAISNFDWHSKCTYAQETWRRSCLRRTQRRIEKKPQWTGIGWKRERTFSWFHPPRFVFRLCHLQLLGDFVRIESCGSSITEPSGGGIGF